MQEHSASMEKQQMASGGAINCFITSEILPIRRFDLSLKIHEELIWLFELHRLTCRERDHESDRSNDTTPSRAKSIVLGI
ncbi:hypothetical protein V3C99_007885 [Haemonchus contortus]